MFSVHCFSLDFSFWLSWSSCFRPMRYAFPLPPTAPLSRVVDHHHSFYCCDARSSSSSSSSSDHLLRQATCCCNTSCRINTCYTDLYRAVIPKLVNTTARYLVSEARFPSVLSKASRTPTHTKVNAAATFGPQRVPCLPVWAYLTKIFAKRFRRGRTTVRNNREVINRNRA